MALLDGFPKSGILRGNGDEGGPLDEDYFSRRNVVRGEEAAALAGLFLGDGGEKGFFWLWG